MSAGSNRRQRIEQMLEEKPHDQMLRYALALELEKERDHERSLALLAELCDESPPYVAAFFMAGQQLARLERFDEARSFLRRGIDAARQAGDSHAAAEMSELLVQLGSLGEATGGSPP